ncbi:uncharacterized protein LOC123524706 isoform X2 [Mercenaria mercenaria]|uniref:uncharacterized protein LOC123524706 isoform X2 n=1 Tax=Mercenaria mercenaria TaxID=6596 RepID=UPI00234EBD90|nr:uncharacterized protein LOC123524706 isoform X2 [Mercenaria mercenaria]
MENLTLWIIRDLPRFIRIGQETVYTPPEQSHATSSLAEGTKLEVKYVSTVEKIRYIKCKSKKTSRTYLFREDFPINCSAAEDPDEHTFLNLAGEFILLPKNVQFENVWADDVVLKDDDEASTMLTLTGGPIKILKSFVRRNMYIAWMKPEGTRQTVGLISSKIWNNQLVQPKVFKSESQKNEYIRQHFGESLDSNFVVSSLYMMKPIETRVVWLLAPKVKMTAEKLADYENIAKTLSDYENVFSENEEDDNEDYEKPMPQVVGDPSLPPKTVSQVQDIPPDPPLIPKRELILLPTPKARKEDILQKIKEKAKLGFDKVHEQLLKRSKQKSAEAYAYNTKTTKQKQSMIYSRSKTESGELLESQLSEKKRLSKNLSERVDNEKSHRLSKAYEVNRHRPLPELPSKGEINITDDDKLDMYDDVEDKEAAFLKHIKEIRHQNAADTKSDPKLDTLARYPDLKKIGRARQTKEDFYSYTVQELVECLKMCSLDKFAIDCSTNKLDGAFFRDFDLNELMSDPFSLSKLDVFKIRKIINEGWRPKTEQVSK